MKSCKKLFSVLLCLLIFASLFSSCGSTEKPDAVKKDSIVIGTSFKIPADPPNGTGVPGLTNAFESLIRLNEKLELVPGLIKEWKRLDESTWEIKLRDDVKFHNGKQFNADAVKFAFTRYLDLENPDFVGKRVLAAVDKDSFEILDNFTLRVKTLNPNPGFPMLLTQIHAVEPEEFNNGKAVGSGPFIVKEAVADQYITVERNEDYWGKKPEMREITFKHIPDASAKVIALKNGEIDIMTEPTLAEIPGLKNEFQVLQYSRAYTMKIVFNYERALFSDMNIKRAIAHAVDRNALCETIYKGVGRPAHALMPPELIFSGDSEVTGFEYDPELAKTFLKNAGYEDSDKDGFADKDGKNLKLAFLFWSGGTGFKESAEAIAQYLKDAGIDAEITPMDEAAFFDTVYAPGGQFDIALDMSGVFFGSSSTELNDDFYNKSGLADEPFNISDDEINRLYEEGIELESQGKYSEAREKYVALQKHAFDDLAACIPVLHYDLVIVANKDIVIGAAPLPIYDGFLSLNTIESISWK